jgi:hypothetical protein
MQNLTMVMIKSIHGIQQCHQSIEIGLESNHYDQFPHSFLLQVWGSEFPLIVF